MEYDNYYGTTHKDLFFPALIQLSSNTQRLMTASVSSSSSVGAPARRTWVIALMLAAVKQRNKRKVVEQGTRNPGGTIHHRKSLQLLMTVTLFG